MKIEMLGHANLLVRCGETSILFDPLFHDTHHEGVYDVYPSREIDTDAIPDFDAVVLSHAHADHFDLPSVALLPRGVPVLIPADPSMMAALEGLGFHQIVTMRDLEPIAIGELELVPTPAARGSLEHGFIIQHEGKTLWNLVDTFPSHANIEAVLEAYGPIDLLITPWQPLHDTGVSSGSAAHFPHGMYNLILSMIAQINPGALIPGACGFWALEPAVWTNAMIFPLTRERFMDDLIRLRPDLKAKVHPLEPGDALLVSQEELVVEHAALSYVRATKIYDWRERSFRPLELLGPKLNEHRGEAASLEQCEAAVEAFFTELLPEFVAEHTRAFSTHQNWAVVRQYEVVFDGGVSRYWTGSFDADGFKVRTGEDPTRCAFTTLSAGLLIALVAGSLSWNYAEMSGQLRRFDFTYYVDGRGLHLPRKSMSDPLVVLFSAPFEREQYQMSLVEALDQRFRKAALKMGIDPASLLVGDQSVKDADALDPEAIARSVMDQYGITPADLDDLNSER